MIYTMARDIADGLIGHKWPVAVSYDRDLLTKHGSSTMRVVFERDTSKGDAVGPAAGFDRNPRKTAVRRLGVQCTVFIQSPTRGARKNEHEHLCDDLIDALLGEIQDWGTASRAGDIAIDESRYLSSDECATAGVTAGVAYVLRFKVPRGVRTRDYTGDALPEGSFTASTTAVKVSNDGANYEDI